MRKLLLRASRATWGPLPITASGEVVQLSAEAGARALDVAGPV